MKSYLVFFLLIVSGLVLSCGTDPMPSIVGTWAPAGISITGCNDPAFNVADTSSAYPRYPTTFGSTTWEYTVPGYKSGTGFCYHGYCPPPVDVPPLIVTGTYTITGNTITLKNFDGTPDNNYRLTVTRSSMIFSEEIKYYYTTGCQRNYKYLKQ